MENSGIKTTFGPITIDGFQDSFKKGLKQVQLRQEVIKSYPSARLSNDLQDSLFDAEELGLETTDFTEVRMAWREVGEKMTQKEVAAKLATFPDAMIYKVLSHDPIISEDQKRVIRDGLTGEAFESFKEKYSLDKEEWDAECSKILYDNIAERQIVRYGEDNDANKPADEPILFNGKVQYKATLFSQTKREDVDLRIKAEEKQEVPSINLATENVAEGVKA